MIVSQTIVQLGLLVFGSLFFEVNLPVIYLFIYPFIYFALETFSTNELKSVFFFLSFYQTH